MEYQCGKVDDRFKQHATRKKALTHSRAVRANLVWWDRSAGKYNLDFKNAKADPSMIISAEELIDVYKVLLSPPARRLGARHSPPALLAFSLLPALPTPSARF